MPTESFDHSRLAALLTELNRTERKAGGGGKTAMFLAFATGVIVMGAGILTTPAPRTMHTPMSARSQFAQAVMPPPHMHRQPSRSDGNLLTALNVSAPLSPARSVVLPPTPSLADAGPALEPDLDGDLAVMPKAPQTLVRTPPAQTDSLSEQNVNQPG